MREHTFPIGTCAAALLAHEIQHHAKSGLVFPARGKDNRPFNGWSKTKAALDAKSSVADWTLHDLRRTYRTIHARIGTPPHIAERLINHVRSTSEVEKIYDRFTYMPDMKIAVEKYEAHLSRVFDSN